MLAAITAAVLLAAAITAARDTRAGTRRHTRPVSAAEVRAWHRSRRHHPTNHRPRHRAQ